MIFCTFMIKRKNNFGIKFLDISYIEIFLVKKELIFKRQK